ncbi:MAG: hypothetical protein EXR29_02870 [Betaproteobacteria bacterium]|nr:hypothetical protein [Betaproteobacteria bacterium]
MTLAEVIFEKSKDLPVVKAQEVIDFIDFIKTRNNQSEEVGAREEGDAIRLAALAQIASARIHWAGKPMASRDELHDEARG